MAGKNKKLSRKNRGSWKIQYASYKAENRQAKNKIARLERIVAAFPNDLQAAAALARIKKEGVTNYRQKPKTKGGWMIGRKKKATAAKPRRKKSETEES